MTRSSRAQPYDQHRLPPLMAELHAIVGQAGLLALIERYGGTRLHVPQTVLEGSELAQIVRLAPARRLAKSYGGETLAIGLCKAWRAHVLRRDGHTLAQIARRLGMTEPSVWRLLRGSRGPREARPDEARRKGRAVQLALPID